MNGRMGNSLGTIVIDTNVIATYAGSVAVECFGIVGMASVNVKDGLVSLLKKDKLEVRAENLKDEKASAMITISEESRRMSDMMRMYGMAGMGADNDMFAAQMTLVLNARNPLVAYVYEHREDEKTELFVRQIFDLALLANRPLTPDEMSEFVTRSNEILLQMTR